MLSGKNERNISTDLYEAIPPALEIKESSPGVTAHLRRTTTARCRIQYLVSAACLFIHLRVAGIACHSSKVRGAVAVHLNKNPPEDV